jgi:hypothetical protein
VGGAVKDLGKDLTLTIDANPAEGFGAKELMDYDDLASKENKYFDSKLLTKPVLNRFPRCGPSSWICYS